MFFLLLVLPRITAGSFIMFLASPRAHFVFSTGIRLRYRLATACGAVEARISALANLATTSSTKSRYRSALSKFRHICMPGGGPFSQQELATALSSESLVALFIGTQAEHRYSNETVRVDLTVAPSWTVLLATRGQLVVPVLPPFLSRGSSSASDHRNITT